MNNPLTSRSLIVDKINKKFQKTSYKLHKQKIRSIQKRDTIQTHNLNKDQQVHSLMRLTRNKKAYQSCHLKIEPKLLLQNLALLRHIQSIQKASSTSGNLYHLYKNHYVENQKKEIQKENKILGSKLIEYRHISLVQSRKNLKKQFKEYEQTKNRLRKIKNEQQDKIKSKQKLNKSNQMQEISDIKQRGKKSNMKLLKIKKGYVGEQMNPQKMERQYESTRV